MRHFSKTELKRMQGTQAGAMQDVCRVYAYSSAPDAYGNPSPTYTAGSPVVCGFKPTSREVQGSGEVDMVDAKLRLPIATTLDSRDRIEVTHRYGVAITPEMYEVFGPPERGPSGLVVDLKLVTE